MRKLISIIVPIYGVEKYIKKCVDSILSQTYNEIEVILVDDGSPDQCPSICDEYAKKDSRVRVIHKKNGGLVSARQAGLKVAHGDYIGFVDGDDWIESDMYNEMARIADKYSPDIIASNFYCDFDDKTEISDQCFEAGYYDKERLLKEIYPIMLYRGEFYRFGISPNCWSKLFKKDLLERNLPLVDTRITMGEDAAFTYPCLLEAKSIYCIKKPMYHYRILQSSMSRIYDSKLEDIIFLPYEAICKANSKSDFDISNQLAYYYIYLANFIIRNQAKAKANVKKFAHRLLSNKELEKCANLVSADNLPKHTIFIVNAIRNKNTFALSLYIRITSKYLK